MRTTRLLAVLCFVLLCSMATAKKYWDAPAGQGTSTVGSGGDYATLLAAAADYNTSATTGAWTIEIVSNLTEASNVAFSRENLTHPVTIKPAASTTPVVTFTKTTDNTGPTGHIVIGSANTAWLPVTCNNFTIDGSNNGTNSRDLTFTCAAGVGGRLINVTGNSSNFVVKNIKVNATTSSQYCITFTIRNASGVNYAPINPIIDNVYMNTQGQQAFAVTNSGTIGAYAPRNVKTLTVRNCTIWGRDRGIFLNYAGSANIYNNSFRMDGTAATDTCGVYCYSNNDSTAVNTQYKIYNNTIKIVSPRSSATNGDYAIRVDIPSYLESYNNIIYVEQTGAENSMTNSCRGYYLRAWEANAKIYNNSINIYAANQYRLTGGVNPVTPGYVAGICAYRDNYQGTLIAKNNIIRVNHKGGGCIDLDYQTDATGTATVDNNDYYADTGSFIGQKGTGTIAAPVYTPYATLAEWQAATGKDANTQNYDPLPNWVSSTNLRFSGAPGATWKFGADVSAMAGLATDIDGENRDVIVPYVGADSPVAPTTTITVASVYGSPIPAVGTHNVTTNTLVIASVASPVSLGGGNQAVVTGYTGAGDAPSGAGGSASFTIINPSSLTWSWQMQHQLTAAASPVAGGTITGGTSGSFYDTGTVLNLQANPNSGWFFTGWSGALSGTTNPQNLTMDSAKSVTASFVNADIDITTPTLNFGNVSTGTSTTLNLTVFNLGDTDLVISSLSFSGADAAAYSAIATLPLTISGGGNAVVGIAFLPTAVQTYNDATLTISSNDVDEPTFLVDLNGAGVSGTPDIDLSTVALAFGDVQKNDTATMTVTVTNLGLADLNISGLSFTGANAGEFSLVSPPALPHSLGNGANVVLTVRFAPTTGGAKSATLNIASNDPADPNVTVGLTGTATPPTEVKEWSLF